MSERTHAPEHDETRHTDRVLEQELFSNERIVEHPVLGRLRFQRPTPRKERLIQEARRAQQQADFRNEDVLSRLELERIYVKRGIWSPEDQTRLDTLSRRIGEIVGGLDRLGYTSNDALLEALSETIERLKHLFEGKTALLAAIERYFSPEDGGAPKDRRKISDAAETTEVDDLLTQGDLLRGQVVLLNELAEVRTEVGHLRERHTELFSESVEARAERAERLAQLYHCVSTEDGSPLCGSLSAFEDLPFAQVEWLLREWFYFTSGITSEVQHLFEKHGFFPRQRDTDDSSADSPALPPSTSDGRSPVSGPTSSGESVDTISPPADSIPSSSNSSTGSASTTAS